MKRISKIILLALVAGFFIFLAIFIYSPDAFWAYLAGDPDLGKVDFTGLTKNHKPNQYLVCSPDICKLATADDQSKTYSIDEVTLKLRFIAAVGPDNMEIVENGENLLRFIVRTPFLKFPDTVSVAFFPVEGGSTLAIYSRSQIGHSDFGMNKKRVKQWLAKLDGG